MTPSDKIIAIVDDDASIRRALRRLLCSMSLRAETFASGEGFLESLGLRHPHCVILDLQLPGLRGVDVIAHMRASGVNIPVVVVTGLDTPGLRERCLSAGAAAYLTKPLEGVVLLATVREAMK